ncbi:MAG: tetratricopeptide repeat protein [Flavobacteriaceae bacterium]
MSKRNPELFDLIEGYLNDRLNDTAKREFEERLAADVDLREEVEKHRELHQAMLDEDAIRFRKKLIRIENEEPNIQYPKEKRFVFNWRIAAVIAMVLGLGLFFAYLNTTSEKSLFESHFSVYPLEDTVRGNQQEDLQSAFETYGQEDFETAASRLETVVDKMPDAHELRLYLGSAYLKIGQPQKALSEFESLTNSTSYAEQAKWYKALTYLKMKQNDKVIALLDDIIAFDGIYKNDAMNLYENLNKQLNPDDF